MLKLYVEEKPFLTQNNLYITGKDTDCHCYVYPSELCACILVSIDSDRFMCVYLVWTV